MTMAYSSPRTNVIDKPVAEARSWPWSWQKFHEPLIEEYNRARANASKHIKVVNGEAKKT
jgi:hypothetical protein